MQTKQLDQAYKEIEELVNFLTKREWNNSNELTAILEEVDKSIDQIVQKAIQVILVKLQGYLEEAQLWADNNMTDVKEQPCRISLSEQKKAQVEVNQITRTINKLHEIL